MSEAGLAKRGRPKRQAAWREANEDPSLLNKWNRARLNFMDFGFDHRLATQRGKLFCMRQLTQDEFEAANRWAEMLERYDTLVLGMRRSPASPALERTARSEGVEISPEAIERFKARFQAAHAALIASGKIAELATTKLCRDEAAAAWLHEARRGLGALVMHFGITGKKQ